MTQTGLLDSKVRLGVGWPSAEKLPSDTNLSKPVCLAQTLVGRLQKCIVAMQESNRFVLGKPNMLPKRMIFWKSSKRPLTPLIFEKSYCRFFIMTLEPSKVAVLVTLGFPYNEYQLSTSVNPL